MEERFIERYVEAGVDLFIIDTLIDKNHIGSTGQMIPQDSLNNFKAKWPSLQLMLAGGINAKSIKDIDQLNDLSVLI